MHWYQCTYLSCFYTVKQARQGKDGYGKLAFCISILKRHTLIFLLFSLKKTQTTDRPNYSDKIIIQDFILLNET